MHSWIFRNRRRLEAIYGAPSRLRLHRGGPSRSGDPGSATPAAAPRAPRKELVVYELIPRRRIAA